MVETVIFVVMALVAAGSGMMMITRRNTVHSALYLVIALCALAALFLMLGAEFIAFVQVLVYAGAIMVLFLFVIMILSSRSEAAFAAEKLSYQKPVAIGLSLVLLAEIGYLALSGVLPPARNLPLAGAESNTQAVGRALFTRFLLPFEITSVLLIVAIIGIVVLGKRRY
ncbi:MAG: NADH-quinone oxidoreductase subunit J [Armatimonadetes bacterium]|nr:NADH-quinone oxidoreductase subunit J [Armatimonadota bacterium]